MPTVEELIAHFNLEALPVEGGIFTQTYRSTMILSKDAMPGDYPEDKPAGTGILYLYTAEYDHFSAMHVLPTDEMFHFYMGDPVQMLLLYPDGSSRHVTLGHDVLNGEHVQFVVPAGVYQGSFLKPGGTYALAGTTMAPGFTSSDYVGGEREALIAKYPNEAELITRLTRPESPLHMPNGL